MKLKPCPFCGEADYIVVQPDLFGAIRIRCDNCATEGPAVTIGKMAIAIARNAAGLAWNKRTPPRGLPRAHRT